MTLGELLDVKKVLVCVGSGGVGKTTVAAAIAVHAASRGKKALVLTIDPARRLASSLGLKELGNEERLVPPEKFERAGLPLEGALYAMMLDTKRTFDDLVARYAPTPGARDRILENQLYKHLSGTLAGSQEYMAMEKLYEVYRERDYELVVLDTPPTHNALDFLDAPKRMINVLDTPIFRSLPTVAGSFSKRAFFGSALLLRQLGKFTGMEFFEMLAEFLANFSGMFEGFKERAKRVYEGLQGPEVAFLLVTSPSVLTINEGLFFHEKLREARMPFAGFVINRVNPARGSCSDVGVDDLLARLYRERSIQEIPRDSLQSLLHKLCRNLEEAEVLAAIDRDGIARLHGAAGDDNLLYVQVPRFHHDVYDLSGLAEVARYLFADPPVGPARP
jgi:anion-transporting  ArsA/GET3 family ATPase